MVETEIPLVQILQQEVVQVDQSISQQGRSLVLREQLLQEEEMVLTIPTQMAEVEAEEEFQLSMDQTHLLEASPVLQLPQLRRPEQVRVPLARDQQGLST